MPIYIYGAIVAIISIVFYFRDMANSTINDTSKKLFFKFLVSLSTGLVLLTSLLGGIDFLSTLSYPSTPTWLMYIIFFICFPICFIGFNMLLYGMLNQER